ASHLAGMLRMTRLFSIVALVWLALDASARADAAETLPADQVTFFETKIRPVLVQHCYKCHSATAEKIKGGLLLDTREGARRGGESGPAVVPGDAEASILLSALRYEDFEMPPKGKLP